MPYKVLLHATLLYQVFRSDWQTIEHGSLWKACSMLSVWYNGSCVRAPVVVLPGEHHWAFLQQTQTLNWIFLANSLPYQFVFIFAHANKCLFPEHHLWFPNSWCSAPPMIDTTVLPDWLCKLLVCFLLY